MLFYFILIKTFFVENVLLICILLAYVKIERFQISPLRAYSKDIIEKIIYMLYLRNVDYKTLA